MGGWGWGWDGGLGLGLGGGGGGGEVETGVSPDDLWFGSDAYMNCALIYNPYLDVWLGGVSFVFRRLADGESDGRWWPAFYGRFVMYRMLAMFT